jgi:hypothetical protein
MTRYLAFFLMLFATSFIIAGCGGDTTDTPDTDDATSTGGDETGTDETGTDETVDDDAGADEDATSATESDTGATSEDASGDSVEDTGVSVEATEKKGALSGLGRALGRSFSSTISGESDGSGESDEP